MTVRTGRSLLMSWTNQPRFKQNWLFIAEMLKMVLCTLSLISIAHNRNPFDAAFLFITQFLPKKLFLCFSLIIATKTLGLEGIWNNNFTQRIEPFTGANFGYIHPSLSAHTLGQVKRWGHACQIKRAWGGMGEQNLWGGGDLAFGLNKSFQFQIIFVIFIKNLIFNNFPRFN